MRYEEWLTEHESGKRPIPHLRQQMLTRYSGKLPEYVVVIKPRKVGTNDYRAVISWLKKNGGYRGHQWFEVATVVDSFVGKFGFNDAGVAARFKLTWGDEQ